MAGLLDKLKKNSKIDGVSSLEKSKFYAPKNQITTNVPAINLALSGSLNGGLMSGLTLIAGPSKHFKSSICLVMAAAFQKANPDGVFCFTTVSSVRLRNTSRRTALTQNAFCTHQSRISSN